MSVVLGDLLLHLLMLLVGRLSGSIDIFFDLFFYSIDFFFNNSIHILFDSVDIFFDFLFDLGNVLFLLFSLVADNLTKAVILSDDLVEKFANVFLHAVDLTLPDLLVRGLFLFHEHDEDVIRLLSEQVPPVHEVAKLVILHDQFDFVLVHHLLLNGQ